MGRKLDILLGRTSRQMSKLKPLLDLTVSRLAVLRNRRQVRCNQSRGDVAQLLLLGHVDRALLRVEHVIKEQNMLDVFVMLDHYCHLLTERAMLLDHKECPEELREAMSSLIFAASRCAELPELDKVRGIFSSKYGKEFVSAAVELRNDCCVNTRMIQKLSTRQPSLEIRERVTKEIAAEKGINLEFDDPSSNVAEGDSIDNPEVNLIKDQFNSDENLSTRTHQKYEDVATAAQAAFESAAFAAAAARAAVELCRSESQGKGCGGDKNKHDSQNFEKIQHDQNHGSDSEEGGIKAKQNDLLQGDGFREKFNKQLKRPSSSSSDSSEEEDDTEETEWDRDLGRKPLHGNHEGLSPEVQEQRQFDVSSGDASSPDQHPLSYLNPPYSRGNDIKYSEQYNSLHEEKDKEGLQSGTEGNDGDSCNTNVNSADKMNLSAGKKPMSVRTRRGL